MAEMGEAVAVAVVGAVKDKYLIASVSEVEFQSGIDLHNAVKDDPPTDTEFLPGGHPHWGKHKTYPAVYVRAGGTGETKKLRVKVRWRQKNCAGAATLRGASPDGKVVVEGKFTISSDKGSEYVDCEFTQKPNVVKNYGTGIKLHWVVSAAGRTSSNNSTLKLFFLDAAPLPMGWGNHEKHYLKIVDWATQWAEGKSGNADVLNALWDKFSDGTGARVPHVTKLIYWKTNDPVQNLRDLVKSDSKAQKLGWSCRAIAHVFMECLTLHGIKCLEVIPFAPGYYNARSTPTRSSGGKSTFFLVQNWATQPFQNNWSNGLDYYGGSWVDSDAPPLKRSIATTKKWVVDLAKQPGVPAQGQRKAPLGFMNHWIVEVNGRLYDTSYGAIHANDIDIYRNAAIAGWVVKYISDGAGLAWVCQLTALHPLVRVNGSKN